VAEVDERFVRRWVERLRAEVPDAVAVFLGGSRLRGDAGPYSDVDFNVLVADGPRDEWPAWFDDGICVSTWIRDIDTWRAAQREPQGWAFGLPCADRLRLYWADHVWRERLDVTEVRYPAAEPEIDHFEGSLGKVANAWASGDPLSLRLAGQDLARAVISLVQPLNEGPPVFSRVAALHTLLDFAVVPLGYRDAMLTCLGLAERYAGPDDVFAAAGSLARGVLGLIEEHVSTFTALLPADAAGWLSDGSLRQYVERALPVG
jgi:hypothetical protein